MLQCDCLYPVHVSKLKKKKKQQHSFICGNCFLGPKSENSVILPDEDISKTVDEALKLADQNQDGYIDYREFKSANK